LTVVWTLRASTNYEKIITFILEKFTLKEAIALIRKVNTTKLNVSIHKHICPISKKKNIYRCVIHQNTSLLYRIKNNELHIIALIDNRSNHKY
jgi:plasmid stabilization system protein ParE